MNKFIVLGLFIGASLFADDVEKDPEGRIRPGTRMIAQVESAEVEESLEVQEKDEEGRVRPGIRLMAHSEWLKLEEERFKEDETTEELVVLAPVSDLEATEAAFSAGIYFSSHKGAYQAPALVTAMGGIVELRDRSIWVVSEEDRYKTLNWLPTDIVVISPNHEWFSTHAFRMTNQNTGVAVKCNLKFGPLYNGKFSHWVVAINHYTQEIFLEDGSIWQVSGFDTGYFSKWLNNDTVIIGINDGFLQSSKPNILINVQTLTYVRAICTYTGNR